MYILAWLLFYWKRFGSRLSPFSNNLFYYRQVLLLSNVPFLMLSAFDTLSLFSSIVFNRQPESYALPIHPLFWEALSYLLVITDGFHTLFSSADETSFGTTYHFLSIYLPHLLQLIPSSYWTLVCFATLSLTIASCDFYSSDQKFAIRLPSDSTSRWTPLSLAVSFPLLGTFTPYDFYISYNATFSVQELPFCGQTDDIILIHNKDSFSKQCYHTLYSWKSNPIFSIIRLDIKKQFLQ